MKRSDRFAQSNETYQQDMREPHYNTYYQPVGKPPKKKKVNVFFKNFNHINNYYCSIFRINVFYVF